MPLTPARSGAIPPATAAVVSASLPRAIAERTVSSQVRFPRRRRRAERRQSARDPDPVPYVS